MNRNIITQADADAARATAERAYSEAFEAGRASVLHEQREQGRVVLPPEFARDLDEWMSDPSRVSGQRGERLRDQYRAILNGDSEASRG